MRITCQKCGKNYNLKDEKVPKKNFKLKCPGCHEYIHISVQITKPPPTAEVVKDSNSRKLNKVNTAQSDGSANKKLSSDLMYCKACGKPIPKDSSFCSHCGESFKQEKETDQKAKKEESPLSTLGCLFLILIAISLTCTLSLMYCSDDGVHVTKEQYGEDWPFTVDEGYVYSVRQAAIFKTGGIEYQLNGIASSRGYKSINPIWRNNPKIPGTKINIGPFISLALKNPK